MSVDLSQHIPADLDPDIARFVSAVGRAYAQHPALATVSPAEARAICERVRAPWTKGGPAIASVYEETLKLDSGAMRVRVYDPDPSRAKPALLYLHGGGFCLFSLDTHDRLMREYAARSGFVVIGLDYPLSPEAKFPTALYRIVDTVLWLAKVEGMPGIDTRRLALGGDSAGANLSAGAAIILRDRGFGEALSGLVFNYGAFAQRRSPEAVARYGGAGYMLTEEECEEFCNSYLEAGVDLDDPLVSPINADLSGLPPALLIVPQCDILSEQSIAFAAKMRAAGGGVEIRLYPGATHSFLEAMSIAKVANQAIDDTAAWLRALL